MRFRSFILGILISNSCLLNAQLVVDAELRPRFEYRHGFRSIFPENANPAAFVSQRTRVNLTFSNEKVKLFLSGQDVRVWGDTPQLNLSDKNGFGLHQAWAEVVLNKNLALKLGRQEVVYDDQRFFGNVGWAQQARSHDLALLKLRKDGLSVDVGLAFNQDVENVTETILTANTYKSIQYFWLNKKFESSSISFLALNNGEQFIDKNNKENNETRYSQTIGTHFKYGENKFKSTANVYFQFGEDVLRNTLSSYLIGVEGQYAIHKNIKISLGGEQQSGNDFGSVSNHKNKAFTPLYGTNHKFNGLIDYFYVGTHKNNVGLVDLYMKSQFIFNKKSDIAVAIHNFSSQAEIQNHDSKELGTEIDVVYNYHLFDDVNLKMGYSQIFDSEGLRIVKNNFNKANNHWAWVMLTIKTNYKPVINKSVIIN